MEKIIKKVATGVFVRVSHLYFISGLILHIAYLLSPPTYYVDFHNGDINEARLVSVFAIVVLALMGYMLMDFLKKPEIVEN